jgi:hypothetical protein
VESAKKARHDGIPIPKDRPKNSDIIERLTVEKLENTRGINEARHPKDNHKRSI